MNISMHHTNTLRNGDFSYGKKIGDVRVFHDGSMYVYSFDAIRPSKREFRDFIKSAWGKGGAMTVKIDGKWPEYTIETYN